LWIVTRTVPERGRTKPILTLELAIGPWDARTRGVSVRLRGPAAADARDGAPKIA